MPTIRPIILKGHSRPLTCVKFNRQGDLLFTCAKDNKPNVWWTDNGERLGTFNGHKGAVSSCDINYTSTKLLTGAADQTAKLWDVKSGKELYTWTHRSNVKCVNFATGERMMLTVQDNSYTSEPTIFVYNLTDTLDEQTAEPVRSLVPVSSSASSSSSSSASKPNISSAVWGSLNQTILSSGEDGIVRTWDVESGKEISRVVAHKKKINGMQLSKDRSMLITASSDHTARLYDVKSLTLLKTFSTDRPLNDAAISPVSPHCILGGGQEAMNVTTTSNRAGHFEIDFYHAIYAEMLGSIGGHFGPVNTLAFSPKGTAFASGAEDGYVRLHHIDREALIKGYQ